jgi:rRNA maturation RNase YbeY
MAISFFNEDIKKPKLDFKKIKTWMKALATIEKKKIGNINFIFCSDEYLLSINEKHLKHDFYTDIITFDYCENNILSGDIFISIDRVNENAQLYNSMDTEIYRVLIHGLLHLIGFDDQNDDQKQIMRGQEEKAIELLFAL